MQKVLKRKAVNSFFVKRDRVHVLRNDLTKSLKSRLNSRYQCRHFVPVSKHVEVKMHSSVVSRVFCGFESFI